MTTPKAAAVPVGMLSSTKRFAAEHLHHGGGTRQRCHRRRRRQGYLQGLGLEDGPSSQPIKAVEPGANTLDGHQMPIGQLHIYPGCPHAMPRKEWGCLHRFR